MKQRKLDLKPTTPDISDDLKARLHASFRKRRTDKSEIYAIEGKEGQVWYGETKKGGLRFVLVSALYTYNGKRKVELVKLDSNGRKFGKGTMSRYDNLMYKHRFFADSIDDYLVGIRQTAPEKEEYCAPQTDQLLAANNVTLAELTKTVAELTKTVERLTKALATS